MVTFMTEQCVSNVVILELTMDLFLNLTTLHSFYNNFKVTMSLDLCNAWIEKEKKKQKTKQLNYTWKLRNRLGGKHQNFRAFKAMLSSQTAHYI